ncbi:SWI3-like protein, putative [Theileria annulata]|uniref:SWI3-like protein, putative n=1 Tax=Theileria annulata TaxID=5874 RepID=Q4UB70_THEAN|nr:SWI3-like protein, putative [Theileria annulata]CAI75931.1 SWI3-like protein, putative [Theileria annulata]|eukprot:XP_955407.1 SWI3-like protein, putative [Theileria annulata]
MPKNKFGIKSTNSKILKSIKKKGGMFKKKKLKDDSSKNSSSSSTYELYESSEFEIPEYTQWFDINSVNFIEEECTQNIFIGYGNDKDAICEHYKKIRNKIINLYRKEPDKYLSVTECVRKLGNECNSKRNIGGDASIVMKIHSFLNYWGIINFQARNESGERIYGNKMNIKADQSSTFSTPSKNFSDVFKTGEQYFSDSSDSNSEQFDPDSPEDVVRYSAELNSGQNVDSKSNYPKCCGCNNICRNSYYILGPEFLGGLNKFTEMSPSVRRRGIWCTQCYCNSNYPMTLTKESFVRIDLPQRLSESLSKVDINSKDQKPWSEKQFEKLYEAIRKYGTDWQSVAQHIGGDITPNECILQFVNAPLEHDVTSKLKLTTYMEPPYYEDINPSFPFFDSPNPIVTLLSFCASVISPVVASSAAKAAFDVIFEACKNNTMSPKPAPKKDLVNESEMLELEQNFKEMKRNSFDHSLNSEDKPEGENEPSTDNSSQNPDTPQQMNKLVDTSTLQLAAKAALDAAAARSGELASLEDGKLTQVLPNLISLKIKRISEKLKKFNETQEQMIKDQQHLVCERELHKILKYKGFLQENP